MLFEARARLSGRMTTEIAGVAVLERGQGDHGFFPPLYADN
jgi:hypothetical protein